MTKKTGWKPIVLLVYVFSVLFLTVNSLFAGADAAKQVDRLAAQWVAADSPGYALAVIKNSKMVYKKGYGLANLEHGVPITPSTVFYVGSVSKQFVAFCAALLESRGQLDLDDDIRKYIPEMPDYGVPITVRHLIHHTSGIRDYLMLMHLAGLDLGYFHSEKEVIGSLLKRQKGLDFKPGEKHQYSNSGYLVLAEIVHRVSGKSFREFARENILKPLGMKHSRFHDDFSQLIKNRASAYFPAKNGGYRNFISRFDLVGSGGLYTTVEDLFLWDQNFYHCKVGGADVVKRVLTRGKLNDNNEITYAFGLVHGTYKGLKTVQHSGALGGYRAMLLRFPEQEFSVICLANYANLNVVELCQKVADIYLEDQLKAAPPKRKKEKKQRFAKLSRKQLQNKTGTYRNRENGRIIKLSALNNRLIAAADNRKIVLAPLDKTRFKIVQPASDSLVTFVRKTKGTPFTIHTLHDGRLYSTYEPVKPVSPTPEYLNKYKGEFFSEELNVTYTFVVREKKLWLKFRNAANSPLKPTIEDEFTLRGTRYQFYRDKNNKDKVLGFTLSTPQGTRIQFKYIKD